VNSSSVLLHIPEDAATVVEGERRHGRSLYRDRDSGDAFRPAKTHLPLFLAAGTGTIETPEAGWTIPHTVRD
jgi:hypothetical protein